MPRYTDIDKLIAEYDRVHIGPAGGARKLMVEAPIADVAPRAEVIDEFVKRLLDAFPEPHRGGNLCPAIYYDDYREIIEELAVELKEAEGNK